MNVSTKVIIENEKTKVVQFLWSKPITADDLNNREMIDEALDSAIEAYVADKNYLQFSAYKNPLLKRIGRLVIIKDFLEYPEIERK